MEESLIDGRRLYMTKEIAKEKVLKKVPTMKVIQELELPSRYVFALSPKESDEDGVLDDPFIAVDKKTGKVSGFNPQMDLENFKKAINRGK